MCESAPHRAEVRGYLKIACAIHEVDVGFKATSDAALGWKINRDCRLLLTGAHLLFERIGLSPEVLGSMGCVLGTDQGSEESYRRFEEGLRDDEPDPVAYSHALHSSAAAALVLQYKLSGPAITLVGRGGVAGQVMAAAHGLLRAGRVSTVLAGAWGLHERSNKAVLALCILGEAPRHEVW